MVSTTRKLGLLAAAQLLHTTASNAQTWNDSSVQGCQGPINLIASGNHPFNSTGIVRLAPDAVRDEPWYISLTITDRRDPHYIYGDSASWQEREGFLSVPSSLAGSDDGNQTEWCMYTLPAQDVGSQEEDGDCGGILSDDCISALRDNTPPMSDGECYRPDNLEEACGTSERRKLSEYLSSSYYPCLQRRNPLVLPGRV